MPLPGAGSIRLRADAGAEAGLGSSNNVALGSSTVRGLYGVSTGPIRLAQDGYGKSLSSAVGWNILLMYSGYKMSSGTWINTSSDAIRTAMGSPGTAAFMTSTATTSGATGKTAFGQGAGLYECFFTQKNITKVALVDGSSTSLDPTQHSNYLIYNLVESTGNESINDILKRLDIYLRDTAPFHQVDTVFLSPSVTNFTAGINGYSGLLASSGGTAFKTNDANNTPDKFCVMGINIDADNDIQALCAYNGNLASGKGDTWRNTNPTQTFWSYWGDDFYTDSRLRRPGNQLQTAPGIATGCSLYSGNVYLLAYTAP